MTTTLGKLSEGDRGIVEGFFGGGGDYRRKLLAMGLTPKTTFRICRVAPLGDPIQIELRGFQLSIRRDEAAIIKVSSI
ncbi:MAG: FeoA family protein [Endozoicomonas sp. (ex Botrylloides leachii)]|nr:FeoA family protein [Endozoicomonas sp. (ex Botrylloides leachii)]